MGDADKDGKGEEETGIVIWIPQEGRLGSAGTLTVLEGRVGGTVGEYMDR